MINFEYIKPTSSKAAIEAHAKEKSAAFIAGGTNLVDLMKKGVQSPMRLIDINGLPLKTISVDKNGLQMGALALNSEVAEHPLVKQQYPLLSMALLAGASPQLRNMATVGGNILQRTRCPYFYDGELPCNKRNPGSGCAAIGGYNRMHAVFGTSAKCIAVHPSDMCVALSALDATVTLNGPKQNKTFSINQFLRLPGEHPELDNELQKAELIGSVTIPANSFNKYHYLKIRDRASYAFALVSVAVAMQTNGSTIQKVQLAMGGVAHKPWRLTAVEKMLEGKALSRASFEAAANMAMEGAQGFGQNNFKINMGRAAVLEALIKAAGI